VLQRKAFLLVTAVYACIKEGFCS